MLAAAGDAAPSYAVPSSAVPSSAVPTLRQDDGEWIKSLYSKVSGSVVRVETDRGVGTGFAFHSDVHIATAFHVIFDAQEIQIVLMDGTVLPARVVAHDQNVDLAILEVSLPLRDTPVLSAASALEVGDPVAAIGHPLSLYQHADQRLKGLLDWTLTTGIVGAISPTYVQTDTAVNPGNSGGPLLSPEGEVVGVISFQLRESQGVNVAVRVTELVKLTKKIGTQPPPPRVFWEKEALEVGFLGHYGSHTLRGLGIGLDMSLLRRFFVMGRIGLLNGSGKPQGDEVINRVVDRTTFELETGYRLRFGAGDNALSFGVGAALQLERTDSWLLEIEQEDPACTTGCSYSPVSGFESTRRTRFLPMLSTSLTLYPLRAGYAYQLEPGDRTEAIHRLFLGLAL